MERGAKYDWDEYNKAHIAAHNVEPHEVEEVLASFTVPGKTRIDPQRGGAFCGTRYHESRPGSARRMDASG